MATTDKSTPLQALLALYGALDLAVTGYGGAEVEATVERYLPGSTGPNAGWYDELLGFLATGSNDASQRAEPSPATPDLGGALAILESQGEPLTRSGTPPPLTAVQLSRMVYAIGALSHLPVDLLPRGWEEQFSRTLAIAGPRLLGQSAPVRGMPPSEELFALLRTEFRRREDFPQLMAFAAQQQLVDNLVAAVPLCEAKAKWVRGHLCVVLTTEFSATGASLDEVKNVMDPLNWPKCLPFFCSMDKYTIRTDGWSRVLEHVSTTCPIAGTPQMITPLKYLKGPVANDPSARLTAFIDYTLDDDPVAGEKGDGRMVVDEGFIRMTSTSGDSTKNGVRIRTKKVAGFRNLAYFPAALLACLMGYAIAGEDMVLNGVGGRRRDNTGWTNWDPSTPTGAGGSPQPGQPAADDGDPSRHAVALAVEMLNECIDDMSKTSADLATKWASGKMPVAETMSYTADLAARLSTDPWRYLERLRDSTKGGNK